MKRNILSLVLFFLIVSNGFSQNYSVETKNTVYKVVDGDSLEMTMYIPNIPGKAKLPAIVFFFGGGWTGGTPTHFKLQAEYLASRGIIAICPDYRTKKSHNTTPFECVKDAKSAMRFIKLNADNFRINADKIVTSGGSAGGHLAACTALIDDINEDADNLEISPNPFALILFNPVVDTGKRGYGNEKVKGREFEISPVHHIKSGIPPTLIMHGKADKTVPYENVVRFTQLMKQEGNECKLVGYKKQSHGFFNYNKKPKCFKKTLKQTENFLDQYDLLRGESWVKKYCKTLN